MNRIAQAAFLAAMGPWLAILIHDAAIYAIELSKLVFGWLCCGFARYSEAMLKTFHAWSEEDELCKQELNKASM